MTPRLKNSGADGDGCEWNPETNRPAEFGDRHFNDAHATVIVGGQINYRLCDSCAALPNFKRMKKRVPIERKAS